MNHLIQFHDNKYQNGSSFSGNMYSQFSDSWDLQSEEKTLYGQVDDAMIGGLRPAVIYQVRVFAENELGRSKEGRVLQVRKEKTSIKFNFHLTTFQNILQQTVIYLDTLLRLSPLEPSSQKSISERK